MPTSTVETDVWVKDARKIAIIGGGALGAITLDSLVQENKFSEIVLFERREDFGGVWILDDPVKAKSSVVRPGLRPDQLDPPIANPFINNEQKEGEKLITEKTRQERFVETPSYHGMLTNIIERLMTYSDETRWLDRDIAKYADREDVRQYIERYILRHADRENVRVERGTAVEEVVENQDKRFLLTLRHSLGNQDEWYQESFDAIVICLGHYHVPFIPNVPGLAEAQERLPGLIEHLKWFRGGESYKEQTLVVVGARTLGADVTRFAADWAHKVVQLVRPTEKPLKVSRKANVEIRPEITRIDVAKDTETPASRLVVHFTDGSSVSPDRIIYATGYQYLYPFLRRQYGDITDDGVMVPTAWLHTFLINQPRITIVGIPTDAISFRAFEYQAVFVARYLAGRVLLPPVSQQRAWARDRLEQKGRLRLFHTVGAEEALTYMRTLAQAGFLKPSHVVGRDFPNMSEADVAEYVENLTYLRDHWDCPRV